MKKYYLALLASILFFAIGCGEKKAGQDNTEAKAEKESKIIDPMKDKGIGPIKSLVLSETIDEEMVKKGEDVYNKMCTACHKPDKNYIGPSPTGVLDRRTPEWVMNMILNPEEMIMKNEAAKKLLMEYNGAPMANQNLTEEEARAILEYFRTLK